MKRVSVSSAVDELGIPLYKSIAYTVLPINCQLNVQYIGPIILHTTLLHNIIPVSKVVDENKSILDYRRRPYIRF